MIRRILASKLNPQPPNLATPPRRDRTVAYITCRLINILKAAGQPVPEDLMKFGTTVKKKQHGTYGAFFKDVDMSKKGTKITFDD